MVANADLIGSTCVSDCSPINFSVTWSDSGFTHLASGANPDTPSAKSAMRWRMDSSMSRAMKRRILVRVASTENADAAGVGALVEYFPPLRKKRAQGWGTHV